MTEPVKSKIDEVLIEAPNSTPLGIYVNFTNVSVAGSEITLNLCFRPGAANKAWLRTQVIMTGEHAVNLYKLMARLLQEYEQTHGPIGEAPPPNVKMIH